MLRATGENQALGRRGDDLHLLEFVWLRRLGGVSFLKSLDSCG